MPLKALIFDVDGTLAETEGIHLRAFNQAFKDYGLDWHWDEALYRDLLRVTGGKERMAHFAGHHDLRFLEQKNSEEVIRDLHRCKTDYYVKFLKKGSFKSRPGIVRLIHQARQEKIKLSIATTTSHRNIVALLQGMFGDEGEGYFDVIAGADAVPKKKPLPDVYHYVLQHLALKPSDCLAFEDSQNGLESATAAGVPTIVTLSAFTQCPHHKAARAVVSDLGEPTEPCRVFYGDIQKRDFVDLDVCSCLLNT